MKSNLITRSGHDKLVAELQHLWHEERPEITKKSKLGGKSQAIALKTQTTNITSRFCVKLIVGCRYLGKRLEELHIIDFAPEQEGKVYFGAWVEIENEQGEQKTLRIVGVDEIYDHHPQHISINSPMARALLV